MVFVRIITLLAVVATLGGTLAAQEKAADPAGGWGLGSPYNRRYDAGTEVTFKGRVAGVHRMKPRAGMAPGVMVLVTTLNGGTALVELGPAWYVDNQPFKIALKDRVSVTGSKVYENGKSSIISRKIVLNNRVAYLRGLDGFPMWIASRGHVAVGSANPPTERVFEGRVARFLAVEVGDSGFESTLVVIETAKGAFAVDVGPRWFIERQDVVFQVGDQIVVDGRRLERRVGGLPIILAARVRAGLAELVLRPDSGRPAWAGWSGG